MQTLSDVGAWVLSLLVLLGALPMAVNVLQFLLVGAHGARDHYRQVGAALDAREPLDARQPLDARDHPDAREHPDAQGAAVLPRVAVLVPAWNEAAVLRFSVDRMMALNYPPDRLRLVVVDDASTDETPELMARKVATYGDRVLHLRREKGGQGKAHTLNHGLERLLDDDWAEAVLITDADVVFLPDAIRRMARHLLDPNVGAVTAFIREASPDPNWVNRCIGYEYVAAQAASRRAQNVLGVQGCLAGGAQLHTRANLVALGGRIDTATLAEDTVTTFLTQMQGRSVIFDGNAQSLAEEPADLAGLWKQRLRWSRGNLQVARRFAREFVHPSSTHRLWNPVFVLMWWSILLLPAFMVLSCGSLVGLWLLDAARGEYLFKLLWISTALGFVFTTTLALLIDLKAARLSWLQALLFPGLISLFVMLWALAPRPMGALVRRACDSAGLDWSQEVRSNLALAAYLWVGLCMVAAWAIYRIDKSGRLKSLSAPLVIIVGYGPLLCAITFAAYVSQLRGAAVTWDKTEKTGKVGAI